MAELEDDFGDDDIDEETYADVGERSVRTLVLGDDTIEEDDDNEGEDDGDGDESDPLASGSDREIDAEHEELFGASVNTLLAERGRGRKKRRRPYGAIGSKRRVSEVPHHLTGVMGAATIAYMAKRFDEAELALLRVIKEAPKAVAPHRTLALISEERGDQKKSLTHLMSAVHLDRQDRDLWKRCAALSHELGEEDQAIYCLTNALKGTHGRDAEALQARGQLLSQAGLHRKAADSYIKLLKLLPGDLEVALSIAEMFDLSRILHKAEPFLQDTIDYAERHPPRFEDRDLFLRHEASLAKVVQKLVELRFSQARYEDAAALLTRLQDRRSLGDLQTPFVQRVMLAICQHRSGTRALASVTFNEFFMTPDVIERHPKLMWHVAETCFEANDLGKACRAYSALLELEAYKNHVDVLLRRSKVLEELDRVEEADDDLRRILDITPGHVEATIRLARIGSESLDDPAFSGELGNLKPKSRTARSKRGRAHRSGHQNDGESLVGLSGSNAKKTKAGVYLAKAGGVLSLAEKAYIDGGAQRYLGQLGPYLAAALHLQPFSLHGTDPLFPSEALGPASGSQTANVTKEADDDLKPIGQALLRSLTDQEMVQLVERVIEGMAMLENGAMFCDAVDVLLGIARNRARTNRKLSKHILFLSLYVRLTRGDVEDAFDDIRALAKEWPSDSRLWFLCAKLDVFFGERGDSVLRVKIFRFLVRLVKRQDCVIPVVMAAAVFSARGLAGSYKPGLRLHARVSRGVPTCPLSALCIGTNMLYLSRSRTVGDRNEVTLKAFTYMDAYRQLRRAQFAEEEAHIKYLFELEIDYNIARAMHDLGIVHMAAELYMSILDWSGPPSGVGSNASQTRIPPWINVKRDAAYNLLHILRQSGSVRLALAVMHEHLMF